MEVLGKNIVFIPLRGGSKSIPLKNIKIINGRPLIYWTLDATTQCNEVDKVVVSTDSIEIKRVIENYGSPKVLVINRSDTVSSDTASTESVMLEFAERFDFENIILVQATSPLLKSADLSKGIKKYNQKGIDSVLSVVRQKRFIWSEVSSNTAKPVNYNPLKRPRRQEFEGFLIENGAFYITSRQKLIDSKCRISGNIGVVEMPQETYFEIDEPSDWIIVESLLKVYSRAGENNIEKIRKIKCLLMDCDGVLTDGGMYYSEHGDELKKFNTKDGMGLKFLRQSGFKTGIITGENTKLVSRRAEKLEVDEVFLGVQDKLKAIIEICKKYNFKLEEIAYIGDDINDLDVIKTVGFGCTVQDGMQCIKEVADYITVAKGGGGAVREVADLLLKARG
jgi:YrbI family 3-deoxy-D-manno-octulosonate 8-phosphate phosphatase